jgi:transcriptional regulator of arginine metabolism
VTHDNVLDGHILSIVQTEEIFEQIDLQNRLKERGYEIPQATLSRRLKKLKIAKVAGVYKLVNFNRPSLPLILNIQIADSSLIVLHTHPGNANSIGSFIDKKYVAFFQQNPKNSGILGTIAGDDTVVIIIKSKKDLPSVLHLLLKEFPYLKIPT